MIITCWSNTKPVIPTLSRFAHKCCVNMHYRILQTGEVCAQIANIKSSQLNHNLLLDNYFRALTAPELEIYADAVECAHGTAIGAVDEAAVFYLRAHGLSQKGLSLYW